MDTLRNILSAYQGNGKPYFVLRMYTHCLTCWSVLHGVVDYIVMQCTTLQQKLRIKDTNTV